MKIGAEQRREALRKRTKKGVNERGQKGLGRKSVLDYSKAGDRKIVKYEIKSGKDVNYIDILPFEITQSWYKDLRSISGSTIGLDVGFTDYKLEIPVHRNVGEGNDVFLCLRLAFGKKCPICEEMYAEWDKDEVDQDPKKIQALKPSWRCFYNVYDYDGDGTTPIQLWEDFSYYLFEEALQEAIETEDEGIATFSDLEMGLSIEFKGREKKLGKNPFIEAYSIKFKEREVYGEEILKETFPLDAMLVIPTYEQVAKAHLGMDDEEEETPSESQPETASSGRTRGKKAEEEKPDETLPWNECSAGLDFGVDYNTSPECGTCDEDVFQACAAKQKELEKEPAEAEPEQATPSRSRGRKAKDETPEEATPKTSKPRSRKRR